MFSDISENWIEFDRSGASRRYWIYNFVYAVAQSVQRRADLKY
jgi:hypothetical protein